MDIKINEYDVAINVVELTYIERMKKIYDLSKLNAYEIRRYLFPNYWSYYNYDFKFEILKEAIEKNCLIDDTESLNNYYKGLK